MSVSEIKDLTIDPNSSGRPAFDFVVSNGVGFFRRWGAGSIGSLWTTDGVTATEVGPGPPGTFNSMAPVVAGVVGMQDGEPNPVWRSDGTAAGTYKLGNANGVHTNLGHTVALRGHYYIDDDQLNSGIYETDGNTLWFRGRTLGAWGGTAEYSDGIVLNTFSSGLYTLNSAGVLTMYMDHAALGGFPDVPVNVSAGIAFVVRDEPSDFTQTTLWRTDGTAANTMRLPVSFGKTKWVSMVGSDEHRALIQVTDPKGRQSLWTSDGTAAGTRVIQKKLKGDVVTIIGNTGGHTLFALQDYGATTGELWATDGASGSTHKLTDLNPYPYYPGAQWPERSDLSMQTADGVTYFVNRDGAHGWEIWRTDGTRQGTRLAFDLVRGPASAQPVLDGIVGDRLIFNGTLDRHRGLFAVDLKTTPTPSRPPFAPAPTPFSDVQVSSRADAPGLDALDRVTASLSGLEGSGLALV